MDYLELGAVPYEERCYAVGFDSYDRIRAESRAYAAQLERQFPERPAGCSFGVKAFDHEFGRYCEAAVFFEDRPECVAFAYAVEAQLPARWDAAALAGAVDLKAKEVDRD